MTDQGHTEDSVTRVPRRQFLRGLAASAAPVAATIVLSATGCTRKEQRLSVASMEPVPLDSTHQLFVDDYLVAASGGLRRLMHPAQRLCWPKTSSVR